MLTIQEIRATPVLAPLPRPLRNASGYIEKMPLVLIDLHTDSDVIGRAYSLVYFPELLDALKATVLGLGQMLRGQPLSPRDLHVMMTRRLRLFGVRNLIGVALGGLDMAIWDAYARAQNLSLVATLGAAPRPLKTYNSVGLYNAEEVIEIAEETLAMGVAGLKIKTGFPTLKEDIAAIRSAKRVLGDRCALMVDFNQSLSLAEAMERCRALDDEGLTWIEEPIVADDFEGCSRLAQAVRTPIQIGENFQGPGDMRRALAAHAMDLVMPDAQFIGGVSGWLEAAALARLNGIEMSSHLFVEASAHLLPATPTAHWLEYMDVAAGLLQEPMRLVNGCAIAPDCPGIGLEWDPHAVARCRPS